MKQWKYYYFQGSQLYPLGVHQIVEAGIKNLAKGFLEVVGSLSCGHLQSL